MSSSPNATSLISVLALVITLVTFALGIPAMAYQLIVGDEVRRLFNRRHNSNVWLLASCVLGTSCMAFLWLNRPKVFHLLLQPETSLPILILATGLLVIATVWSMEAAMHGRERLINKIQGILVHQVVLQGFISAGNQSLNDLVYLGERSQPGYEKSLVIKSLHRIAIEMLSAPSYNGGALEPIVVSIVDIVDNENSRGTTNNFRHVLDILTALRDTIVKRCYSNSFDCRQINEAIGRLGGAAAQLGYRFVARICIEAVPMDSRALLCIGSSALQIKSLSESQKALRKLELVAEKKEFSLENDVSNLLGLLALWAEKDETRLRAKSYIDDAKGYFKPSFDECIEKAAEYHYRGARFDIAHKVRNLQANLVK